MGAHGRGTDRMTHTRMRMRLEMTRPGSAQRPQPGPSRSAPARPVPAQPTLTKTSLSRVGSVAARVATRPARPRAPHARGGLQPPARPAQCPRPSWPTLPRKPGPRPWTHASRRGQGQRAGSRRVLLRPVGRRGPRPLSMSYHPPNSRPAPPPAAAAIAAAAVAAAVACGGSWLRGATGPQMPTRSGCRSCRYKVKTIKGLKGLITNA